MTKLTKNQNGEIAKLSQKIVEKWKKLVKGGKEKDTNLEKKDSVTLTQKSSTNSFIINKETNTITESEKSTARIVINFNDSHHPQYRNTIKKLIYEAVVNGDDGSSKFNLLIGSLRLFCCYD